MFHYSYRVLRKFVNSADRAYIKRWRGETMRETSGGENVVLCFGEIGPGVTPNKRDNLFGVYTKNGFRSAVTQNDKDAKKKKKTPA